MRQSVEPETPHHFHEHEHAPDRYSHSHEHDHDHAHQSHSTGEEEAIKRFIRSRGREPMEDEKQQLREHGHTHEHMEHPGRFDERDLPIAQEVRNFDERAFTIGIGGPVGSGKTAMMLRLCQALREKYSIAAVTNDIFTREDGEFLIRNNALEPERIRAIETGGCPHAAVREDISANLQACEELTALFQTDINLVESGGDNLAANFSRELADFIIYVIDVAGGDKVPRKGGPGITQADLLVINKTDLAQAVNADLDVMDRDAKRMRGNGPTIFAQMKTAKGVHEIIQHIEDAYRAACVGGKKARLV